MPLTRRELLLAAALPRAWASRAASPSRLRRQDCFFGLHFDLHPNKTDTNLGRDLTEEMVERLLAKVRPDYVQYDCKGHPGYLGYPSKIGPSASGIIQDSLAIWRRVTARRGVALFIHFSGVWDSLAVEQHPEWAAVHPDGTPDPRVTSTFGPYVDRLMIPELKEAAEKYDLDGAWVDGECWALRPDYSPAAARAFCEATGIEKLPRGPADPGWLEFLELNRQQFRKYVRHYVEELHAFRPGFQIASNWLYTTFAPERPEIPVDFLSGDYLGNASVARARLDARYLSSVGKPWDLMAWGFQRATDPKVGHHHKPAVQLEQEAAVVLAQGGGFQAYYQPTRAGKIDDRNIEVMSRVASFCRARQALSHRSEAVPQIGLVFSRTSLYATTNKLFGGWGAAVDGARGLLDALVENHYSVDVIPEWKLEEVIGTYPLIVVPEWPRLGQPVKSVIAQYVKAGGKVLLAGAENAALFSEELGVRLLGAPSDQPAFLIGREVFANAHGRWQQIEPVAAKPIEDRFPALDSTAGAACAATLTAFGAGQVAAIYGPVGTIFAAAHAPAVREFLRRVVDRVFDPLVSLEGPPTIEIALRRKDGRLLIHLINCTAMQVAGDYAVIDFIPPVGPLRLSVRLPGPPRSGTLEPGARPLPGEWKGGVWTALIDRLDTLSICALR